MEKLTGILLLGLVIQFFIGIAMGGVFFRRLRLIDPKKWEEVGRPGWLPFCGARDALKQSCYFLKREYRLSNDKILARLGAIYFTCGVVYFVYFCSFVLFSIVFLKQLKH